MNAHRSKRVNLSIPMVLSGTDSSGQAFQESLRTIGVSNDGATVRTAQELNVGATVTIENRTLGLAANATVVSVGKRRLLGERVEISVQLTPTGSYWGIVLPA